MSERTLSVLDGSTFVVGERFGDVHADQGREHAFFSDDEAPHATPLFLQPEDTDLAADVPGTTGRVGIHRHVDRHRLQPTQARE